MFQKLLFFLLPFLLLACSSEKVSSTTHVEIYTPATSTLERRATLVVRLNFTNQTFIEDEARWQEKIFGEKEGDLNDYYHEISAHQFEFTPVEDDGSVHNGIITLDITEKHPNPRSDNHFDSDVKKYVHPLLKSAIEEVSASGFDFSLYDSDRDGVITPQELIVIFIFAGQEDAYALNNKNGIWAHQWCTKDITTLVNNVTVMDCERGNYAVFGERQGDHDATIGIIAHELGHAAFELPDLYYGSNTRIGYYGLMSNGSWGQEFSSGEAGDTPTHMSAWSKIDTGWYRYSGRIDSNNLNLHATGSTSYEIIKVPIYKTSNEYFLVENRGLHGYDSGLNIINDQETLYQGGIAIWHIDQSVITAKRPDNIINEDARHKGIDFEEAAGASVDVGSGDPQKNFFYLGNVDQFTPDTTPSSYLYDGTSSSVSITRISAPAETMSLDIQN